MGAIKVEYSDMVKSKGILAAACIRHGVGNPYAYFEFTPDERQSRIEAYKNAIQGAYYIVTVPHHGQYRAAWGVKWRVARSADDLDRLEQAATSGDEVAFSEILTEIHWTSRSAEDYIRAIDLALQVGAHLVARKLATEGAQFHFDSEELQKYARVLAPPQVLRASSRQVDVLANAEWLKANRNQYKGKWVAIKNGQLIASADSHDELIAGIGETKGRSILVTRLY